MWVSGEHGVYLVSDGTNIIYRCKLRTAGFAHLSGMKFVIKKDSMLADICAIICEAFFQQKQEKNIISPNRLFQLLSIWCSETSTDEHTNKQKHHRFIYM